MAPPVIHELTKPGSSSPGRLTSLPELGPQEHRILGTAFYDALFYSVTEKLATADGARRALVLFSDVEDNSSANDMLTAIETAQKSDVIVFSMRYTEPSKGGALNGRNKYGIGVMERISHETGGTDFDAGAHAMKDFFQQIEDDLRSSYRLGYFSSNPSDETFHKAKLNRAFRASPYAPKQAITRVN